MAPELTNGVQEALSSYLCGEDVERFLCPDMDGCDGYQYFGQDHRNERGSLDVSPDSYSFFEESPFSDLSGSLERFNAGYPSPPPRCSSCLNARDSLAITADCLPRERHAYNSKSQCMTANALPLNDTVPNKSIDRDSFENLRCLPLGANNACDSNELVNSPQFMRLTRRSSDNWPRQSSTNWASRDLAHSSSTSKWGSSAHSVTPQNLYCCSISPQVLYQALITLYDDRLIPLKLILRGRLLELLGVNQISGSIADLYAADTETYRIIYVAEDRQRAVFFRDPPPNFNGWVDVGSSYDPYSESMWLQFSKYLSSLCSLADDEFPKRRYRMARLLEQKKGLTLGEYTHLVQLAIGRKLLAYEDNFLKPAAACGRQPLKRDATNMIVSLHELTYYIAKLLEMHPNGFSLSTVKRKIKARFNRELCQSAFNCTKLVDLISVDELLGLCRLMQDKRSLKVTPVKSQYGACK